MKLGKIGIVLSAGLVGSVCIAGLPGCKAGKGSGSQAASSDAVNSGLASLGDGGAPPPIDLVDAKDPAERSKYLLEQASVDLKEALRQKHENDKREETRWARADTGSAPGGSEQPSGLATTPPSNPSVVPAPTPGSTDAALHSDASVPSFGLGSAQVADASSTSITSPGATPAATDVTLPGETADQRSARVFDEFRTIMAERGATSGSWRDFFVAAAVPAVASPNPTPVAMPGNAPANLGPRELASLDAALKLFGELTTGQASSGDPAAVSEAITRAQQTLDPQQMVRVPAAVLCSKVSGYGRYEPFRSNVFPAGVANRAILYVEVDRMSHRPPSPSDPGLTAGDQWAVDVTQELELRLDGDSTLQWRRPEEAAVETSRNKRRDFYLLQEIELPATLSVGTYQLKVIVRDRAAASGSADASSYPRCEASVEFKIAADPNAGR